MQYAYLLLRQPVDHFAVAVNDELVQDEPLVGGVDEDRDTGVVLYRRLGGKLPRVVMVAGFLGGIGLLVLEEPDAAAIALLFIDRWRELLWLRPGGSGAFAHRLLIAGGIGGDRMGECEETQCGPERDPFTASFHEMTPFLRRNLISGNYSPTESRSAFRPEMRVERMRRRADSMSYGILRNVTSRFSRS